MPACLCAAGDVEDVLSAIMAAEDDLISAHRQHIEDNMASVRDEMNLLGDLDGTGAGGWHLGSQTTGWSLHQLAQQLESTQGAWPAFGGCAGAGGCTCL